jgi:membrane complex biogenesis BtpA family protein
MSELLAAIAAGAKPMIGMIQLRPLPGGSRYAGESLASLLAHALREAAVLTEAGFPFLMVQNLGDLPVGRRASVVQVAWMTRIVAEVRQAVQRPVGLNLLENDAEAMFAIASAAGADFVRIKVYVGAMVSAAGIEDGQAFQAIRARTQWCANDVAIFADVHDRTAVPVATAGLVDDVRAAFALGGADGIVITGRTPVETTAWLGAARDAFPHRPMLVGGGATAANIGELVTLADGVIVSSALKAAGDLFGELVPAQARAFMAAAERARAR